RIALCRKFVHLTFAGIGQRPLYNASSARSTTAQAWDVEVQRGDVIVLPAVTAHSRLRVRLITSISESIHE
ncbi:hypothetical protein J3459_018393, partial [Metarhizium acridum]